MKPAARKTAKSGSKALPKMFLSILRNSVYNLRLISKRNVSVAACFQAAAVLFSAQIRRQAFYVKIFFKLMNTRTQSCHCKVSA